MLPDPSTHTQTTAKHTHTRGTGAGNGLCRARMTRAAHSGGGRGYTGRQSIENEGKRSGLHSQSKRGAGHLDRRHGAQLRRAVEVDADPAVRGQARGVSTQGRGLTVKCDNACVQLESGQEQANATVACAGVYPSTAGAHGGGHGGGHAAGRGGAVGGSVGPASQGTRPLVVTPKQPRPPAG